MKPISLLLLLLPVAASADWRTPDIEETPWQEEAVILPAAPKDSQLLPFYGGPRTPFQFYVDGDTLQIGRDGVVRYTLVAKSESGALNITREGMRCDTKEYTVYAIGQRDGTWYEPKKRTWERVQYQERNRQHMNLYHDFMCKDGLVPDSAAELRSRFKRASFY